MKYTKAKLKEYKKYKQLIGSHYEACGTKYKIIWCVELTDTQDKECDGIADQENKLIYILAIWAHEVVHAESMERELHTQSWFHPDIEEHYSNIAGKIITFFANRLIK